MCRVAQGGKRKREREPTAHTQSDKENVCRRAHILNNDPEGAHRATEYDVMFFSLPRTKKKQK